VRLFIGNLPYNVTEDSKTFAGRLRDLGAVITIARPASRAASARRDGSAAGQKAISMWNGQT
jgi:hypothetical protein